MYKILSALAFTVCSSVLWLAAGRAQQPTASPPAPVLFTPGSQLQAGKLPFTLRKVFHRLEHDHAETIPFTETRTFAISRAPLRQNGTLRSSKDYGLSLAYEGAKPHVIVVDDRGLIERQPGGHERQVTVADHPELGTLTDLYLNLLRGNVDKLFEVADVYFTGNDHNWQMGLLPHDAALAKRTGRVIIAGAGRNILRLENQLGDRDTRVLELGKVERNPKYTPEMIQAFFRSQS